MSESITGISGVVAEQAPAGKICKGTIITIVKGRADEFMTPDQCNARKVAIDTAFIEIEIGIEEFGAITTVSFRDYSGVDGTNVISPNTMQGQLLNTYNVLAVDEDVNMISQKKETMNGAMIVWKVVTA
jgi:hypothetical protein